MEFTTRKLVVTLCNLAAIFTCAETILLNKCCPEGEGIFKDKTSDTGYISYECIVPLVNNETSMLNKTLHPLSAGGKDQELSIGFPMTCSDFYVETKFIQYSHMPDEYCIDKVLAERFGNETRIGDGSVVLITCPEIRKDRHGPLFSMTSVAKCCLDNMVYDTKNHMCVNRPPLEVTDQKRQKPRQSLFDEFVEGESSLLNIKHGLIPCTSPNVVYDYKSDDYEFELRNDILKVNRSEHRYILKAGTYCLDETLSGSLVARGCREGCSDGPCVTKCCPEGYIYTHATVNCTDKPMCRPSSDWGMGTFSFHDLSNPKVPVPVPSPDVVGIRYMLDCIAGKYSLDDSPADLNYLDVKTGNIFLPKAADSYPQYCIETFESKCRRIVQTYKFICFPPEENIAKTQMKLQKYSIGLVLSCVFLAATLFVYIALPPLQNLHGKTIMCHVSTMLIAYSCLARVQWSAVPEKYCRISGFVIYFSFLSAFSWLTVMCFDIWWTFGNMRAVQMMRRDKDLFRFLRYGLYAFGVPTVLTVFTLLIDIYDVAPGWLDPNIGSSQCWITTSTYKGPVLILFILPVGLQIFTNMVFFILTARYCNKVKSEIHRMQAGSMGERCKRRFTADKAKFAMNMKLFVVMGMSWILEILSSLFTEPMELWYVADTINILQGIPIFCILVLKRKIFHLMKKRLGCETVHQRPKSDMTMTTGLSSTSSEGRKSIPTRQSVSEANSNGALLYRKQ